MPETDILFVHSDGAVRKRIQDCFKRPPDGWSVHCAANANDALRLLARLPVDLIVAEEEMRHQGATLLLEVVSTRFPSLVRAAFTEGTAADRDLVHSPLVHFFLSLSQDPAQWQEALTRACNARLDLHSEQVKAVVGGLGTLPVLPQVYLEFERVAEEGGGAQDLAEVVSQDAAIAGKLLQLVNSACFGLSREIHSSSEAIAFLGVNRVKSLILSNGLFDQLGAPTLGEFSQDSLWKHAATTSELAGRLGAKVGLDKADLDAAFTAGVLHDLGRLIFLSRQSSQFREAIETAEMEGSTLESMERIVLGATHAEVGAYLLSLWGLPDSIVQAVKFHHEPSRSGTTERTPLLAVHLANAFAGEKEGGTHRQNLLDEAYLEALGVSDERDSWSEAARSWLEKTGGEVSV